MLIKKVTLDETSSQAPSIQFGPAGLYIAWKDGNNLINIMCSIDGGNTFGNKYTSTETTTQTPILVSSESPASQSEPRLYVMWIGVGNENINVAEVNIEATTNKILGFENKQILGETSQVNPYAYSDNFGTVLAWAGLGNDNLNVMFSLPNENLVFQNKIVLGETSPVAPALVSTLPGGELILAWSGSGNMDLNIALLTRGSVPFGAPIGIGYKTTLGETSPVGPALCIVDYFAYESCFYLVWVGDGNHNLNVVVSCDGGKTFVNKFTSPETSLLTPSLCTYNGAIMIAWTGVGNNEINIAQIDTSTLPPAP